MIIYAVKVNHITNPLGYTMERTIFTWKVKDAQGTGQKEARILVAADPEMNAILFDTGFRADISNLGYKADIDLSPRTRYYWTVTVRTDAEGEEAASDVQWFETAKMDEMWQAKWITCENSGEIHPCFEKEVKPEGEVAKARLYISGLGLYEAFCNDVRIGNEYLTPYSNNYNAWVQYQTYDVTEEFKSGGTLKVLLGRGWYGARFGFNAKEDVGFYGNDKKLIAELRIQYADGREEIIGTDESWAVKRSNITFSNLYDGEHVDDTLTEMDEGSAIPAEPPKGRLMARLSLPVTIKKTFDPVELIETPKGEKVFDIGQEITGLFALRVHEPKGTKIHIQTGEILQEGCFYNENLRSAKSEYIYISDGTEKTIIPHFTFFGYRYVKVDGVTDLKKDDFKALAFWSDLEDTGRMETGHELVNRLISNVKWGMQDNFVDVPTDCPQRDERMGWTGDAQVFSPTATILKDTYAFFTKYLYDMAEEQKQFDGMVPDVVPSSGVNTCSTVWGDVTTIIPWNLYLYYGDESILEDHYESMKNWVDYITRLDGDNHAWRDHFHYGDWLALDNMTSAEAVFGATDNAFIADLYYAISAQIVSKAAGVLKNASDRYTYGVLAARIFNNIRDEFYSKTGRCCVKTQTALLLTLKYHLSVNPDFIRAQLRELFRERGDNLSTGFVGTPILNLVLSQNGMTDLAYTLLLNESYPGWLREVKLGATTVWERWNSLLDDGTISGISMNSMNHYSYGSVLEWMFRYAAGINTPNYSDTVEGIWATGDNIIPGCRELVIAPHLKRELGYCDASYDSPSGEWHVRWEFIDETHVKVDVTVPFGCTAKIILPGAPSEIAAAYAQPHAAGTYSVVYETAEMGW